MMKKQLMEEDEMSEGEMMAQQETQELHQIKQQLKNLEPEIEKALK